MHGQWKWGSLMLCRNQRFIIIMLTSMHTLPSIKWAAPAVKPEVVHHLLYTFSNLFPIKNGIDSLLPEKELYIQIQFIVKMS